MKRQFFIPAGLKQVIEQDVKVTVEEVRDVPIQPGDTVTILVSAEVGRVSGGEVELRNLVPVKVTGVRRRG